MKCASCNNDHDGSFGTGKYCSRSCANKRKHSPEVYARISAKLTGTSTGTRKWSKLAQESFKIRHHQRSIERASGPWETLPKGLWRSRILEEQNGLCAICSGPQSWNEKPLTFHIDHINGRRQDHYRENLRAICPNCHSQTETYGHKNVSEEGKKKIDQGRRRSRKPS